MSIRFFAWPVFGRNDWIIFVTLWPSALIIYGRGKRLGTIYQGVVTFDCPMGFHQYRQ